MPSIRPVDAGGRRGVLLAVLLTGQVMASIDGSIVSVAAPTIQEGLDATGAEIQLIVSGYLLTTGVLFVTCARLGDVIGHRRAFMIGLGWFTIASLLCGSAVSPIMLILTRLLQAGGAALLMPQVFSLIHRQWDGIARRRAIGVYSTVLALGVVLGQVGGGVVAGADLFGLGWRPVFLINVPIGLITLLIGARVMPVTRRETAARLDPLGVVLLTAAMIAITVPLTIGQERGRPIWSLIILGVGAVLLVIFVRYEMRAPHPVLDLAALRPRAVRQGLLACCIVMGCYTAFLLTLTLHLQGRLGFTPLQAGIAFVPYAVGFGALSLTWNAYPVWLQRSLPVAGPIACAAGMILVVALFRENWQPGGSAPLLVLAGAGHAAGYSPLIARITAGIDPRLASAISALNSTGPTLAEVVAVAGLGSLYFAAADSADGLLQVTAMIFLLLIIGAFFAASALIVRRRSSTAESSADAPDAGARR
ncbi:MFS transporter [Microlunatus soli]|uniref:Major Facilitator Superfamily protein n=1 Tax=Microlunatus soli TaxID=630515 RepID=A0A1H1QIP1_9ACTN|nr:MFS transporter [Microlunatus soli]SDS23173.1 Major Facilitator Superfamily protein [Microlunatus soli]